MLLNIVIRTSRGFDANVVQRYLVSLVWKFFVGATLMKQFKEINPQNEGENLFAWVPSRI